MVFKSDNPTDHLRMFTPHAKTEALQ